MDDIEHRYYRDCQLGLLDGPEWMELYEFLFARYGAFLKLRIAHYYPDSHDLFPDSEEDVIQDIFLEAMCRLIERPDLLTMGFLSWFSFHAYAHLGRLARRRHGVIVDFYPECRRRRPGSGISLPFGMSVRDFNEI